MCFKRHPDGRWGLEPQRWQNGRSDFWRPLGGSGRSPGFCEVRITARRSCFSAGTSATTPSSPPTSVTEGRRQWIAHYLNARFLRLPSQVEVLVREQHGGAEPGQLRADPRGAGPPPAARDRGGRRRAERRERRTGGCSTTTIAPGAAKARCGRSAGHVAAVFGDELYDMLPQTRGGYGRLQDFGIRFAYERVVLHLEPHVRRVGWSATRRGRCCCLTTSRCHGPAGARSSLPRCLSEIHDSKNAPRARRASRAKRRSAAASARSCRSTASAATGPRNHDNNRHGPAAVDSTNRNRVRPSIGRPRGHRHAAQGHSAERRRTRSAASREPTARLNEDPLRPSLICPTSRGSRCATGPARLVTSRTKPPATTPPATS